MKRISVAKIAHFSGHKGAVYTLCKSVNDYCIYSGGDEGYVAEWNIETKGDGKLVVQTPRPVYSLCADRADMKLYCGTASGNLHVVDLISGSEIRNLEAHINGLYDIQQTEENLITAGGDGRICVWRKSDMALLYACHSSDKSARVIALHPNQHQLAVGFSDYKVRIYRLSDLSPISTLDAHNNSVFALSYSDNGSYLLSGGRDAMLKRWKVQDTYSLEHDIPAHTLHIKSIAFCPDHSLFATTSMDKTIKLWNSATMQLLKVIDKPRNDSHINSINKLLWMNNHTIVTCSDDRQIMAFELTQEEV
ncbi:MAG: WD40 repeat domain-containing protein [Bacteroidota bacterium]|jgi:WD repeat-containing protein 61